MLDQSIPNRDKFPQLWANLTKILQSELAIGKKVVFHCRGGLGRTGLVAALLLMDLGSSARDAIAAVRAARSPRAIETRDFPADKVLTREARIQHLILQTGIMYEQSWVHWCENALTVLAQDEPAC